MSILFSLLAANEAMADEFPKVEIKTNQGIIVLELNSKLTPVTAENFLKYVGSNFYDGTIFHRVIGNFMIQGGGYTQDFKEKPTLDAIENESRQGFQAGLKNDRGTIAMARTNDPHSATSQFFINVVDNDFLNYSSSNAGYAVFGKVIEGMDVVDKIRLIPTGAAGFFPTDVPQTPVVIESVKVLR